MDANEDTASAVETGQFNLVYRSMDDGDRLSFPCDAAGHVDLDALDDMAMADYLLARALVGRRFHRAEVTALPPRCG